jgi:hypothetical protein
MAVEITGVSQCRGGLAADREREQPACWVRHLSGLARNGVQLLAPYRRRPILPASGLNRARHLGGRRMASPPTRLSS